MDRPARTFVLPVPLSRMLAAYALIRESGPNIGTKICIPVTNPVENQIRPIAPTRKNALFAGHEVGAENWATLASLIATCKMSDVNPVDYIADTLRAILDGHPMSRIDDLMPWQFRKASSRAA